LEPLYYGVKLGNVYLAEIHIEGDEVIGLNGVSDIEYAGLFSDEGTADQLADHLGAQKVLIAGHPGSLRELI